VTGPVLPETPVDPGALRKVLDGRWGWIRDEVRETLTDPLFAPREGTSIDEQRELTLQRAQRLATTQGPKLLFPKEYGGSDELGAAITAFETQAFGDLSLLVKNGVQFGLFGGAVLHLGTRRHHERYLPAIMTLELPGCFAMTETGHGSDVASIRTTATYDADRRCFIVHTPDEDARKDYIGNAAAHGRMAVVFAQLITQGESHGVHALLVPIRDENGTPLPGVTIEDDGLKGGLNGVDNGRLWFDSVSVDRDALLDRHGTVDEDGTYHSPIESQSRRFFTMLGTLVQGRISVSGAAVSAAKSALTIAVRYAEARRQFAAPGKDTEVTILDYLAHQRRLLPALAKTYALHFAQSELVAMLHEVFTNPDADDMDRRRLETLAAGTKATTTWHATQTIQTCREACGGQGYLTVNRLPVLKADTDIFTTFEGDNTVLMQLVAKTLLTNYQQDFGELDTIGMVRFVADQLIETVIERTAVRELARRLIDAVPGIDEDTNIHDRGWQLSLVEFRERHVLDGVARRMRQGFSEGGDPFDVFNSAQDHILLAAHAHIDRVVLEAFVSAVDEIEPGPVKDLLDVVCDLHALSLIESERGWFLEHGRLTPARSKAVIAAVNDLCSRLRPLAAALVDGFGIPDGVLGAPIALGAEARRQRAKRGGVVEVAGSAG
jgi:acyl-CoA oxidase